MHLIRETFSLQDYNGIGNFTQIFLQEILAVARSHVAAIGGNALLQYTLDVCTITSEKGEV